MRMVLVIGPSGSGKGTQAKLLAEKLKLPAISMGDLLRQEAKTGSELGQKVQSQLVAGKWAPAELTFTILISELKRHHEGVVLDGFPRLVEQLVMLENYLRKRGQKINRVIHLKVGDAESVRRLTKRAEIDRQISGSSRHDDTKRVIEERLKSFHESIKPILARVRRQGILEEVDGERSVEKIHQDIMARLNG
ncbi:MAG: nucleoside monophosphate kinase [Candidatus Chisholmbacteria bacterium]|nr:nucleoside monophosphate kinase [Candidatus Chisholmbacteria bacterium]